MRSHFLPCHFSHLKNNTFLTHDSKVVCVPLLLLTCELLLLVLLVFQISIYYYKTELSNLLAGGGHIHVGHRHLRLYKVHAPFTTMLSPPCPSTIWASLKEGSGSPDAPVATAAIREVVSGRKSGDCSLTPCRPHVAHKPLVGHLCYKRIKIKNKKPRKGTLCPKVCLFLSQLNSWPNKKRSLTKILAFIYAKLQNVGEYITGSYLC